MPVSVDQRYPICLMSKIKLRQEVPTVWRVDTLSLKLLVLHTYVASKFCHVWFLKPSFRKRLILLPPL